MASIARSAPLRLELGFDPVETGIDRPWARPPVVAANATIHRRGGRNPKQKQRVGATPGIEPKYLGFHGTSVTRH
jgi:hypothetical protein